MTQTVEYYPAEKCKRSLLNHLSGWVSGERTFGRTRGRTRKVNLEICAQGKQDPIQASNAQGAGPVKYDPTVGMPEPGQYFNPPQ